MSWSKGVRQFLDVAVAMLLHFFATTFTSASSRQRKFRQEESSSSSPGGGGRGETSGGAEGGEEDPFHISAGSSESMKQAAFELFGMTIEEARQDPAEARARLEKERRKLALRHHPDRNPDNLEEAHHQMQRLNACYAICARDLDDLLEEGRAATGARTDDDDDDDKENEESESEGEAERRPSNEPGQPFGDKWDQENRPQTAEDWERAEKKRQQEQRKQEREQRNKERREEREWERELATQERKVKAEIRRVTLVNQGFMKVSNKSSSKGKKAKKKKRRGQPQPTQAAAPAPPRENYTPSQAHAVWQYEVEQILSWWTPDDVLSVPKPIQHTMANNLNFLAAAIRVGARDYAMEQILMQAYVAWYGFAHKRGSYASPTATEQMASFHFVATEPIDADRNTILHYISNYEDEHLFEFLMMHLGTSYADALLKENVWGQVPADFCAVCKNRLFKARIDAATEHALNLRQASSGGEPAMGGQISARLRQIGEILQFTDWFRLVHFLIAVGFVGPTLFQHGWVTSFAPFALLHRSSVAVVAFYAGLWLSRTLFYPVAGRFMPASYPAWVFMMLVSPLFFQGVRKHVSGLVLDVYRSFTIVIRTLERFVHSRLRLSRLVKSINPSQLECIELVAYGALWWVASSLTNGRLTVSSP